MTGLLQQYAPYVPIGQQWVLQANGAVGFVRIESVHQGDWDDIKERVLINAVDRVIQFSLKKHIPSS